MAQRFCAEYVSALTRACRPGGPDGRKSWHLERSGSPLRARRCCWVARHWLTHNPALNRVSPRQWAEAPQVSRPADRPPGALPKRRHLRAPHRRAPRAANRPQPSRRKRRQRSRSSTITRRSTTRGTTITLRRRARVPVIWAQLLQRAAKPLRPAMKRHRRARPRLRHRVAPRLIRAQNSFVTSHAGFSLFRERSAFACVVTTAPVVVNRDFLGESCSLSELSGIALSPTEGLPPMLRMPS
jgi:hypothetical protein